MYELHSKLVYLSKLVKVTDSNKDTGLLHNMSIFRTLQIRNVLQHRPLVLYYKTFTVIGSIP